MEYIDYKVIIVGAGAAGIGNAVALLHLGFTDDDFVVLEREKIGSSFKKWPEEMRFITPSFTGNQFGAVDLNAVTHDTSPAFTVKKEHMSGEDYAAYLSIVAEHFQLPIQEGVSVESIEKKEGLFYLNIGEATCRAEFVIWCGGEFQYPNLTPFNGAKYCVHNSKLKSYKDIEGDRQIVIGGYESGIDAAVNLSKLGKECLVVDGGKRWEEFSSDPSAVLSTYTYERLQGEFPNGRIKLVEDFRVKEVVEESGIYKVHSEKGKTFESKQPPILCTGFNGSPVVQELFELTEGGDIALTENDESTKVKNLFLSGPMVRQKNVIFCFIYKFRQRFPIIAKEIGKRLGIQDDNLDLYRRNNMYMDDLSCCDQECAC